VAAARAISDRSFALRTLARALPPALPPLALAGTPSALSSTCPVAISPISLASWRGSRGRLRRLVVINLCRGYCDRGRVQIAAMPPPRGEEVLAFSPALGPAARARFWGCFLPCREYGMSSIP